jgi:hypothetical protein
MTDDGGVTVTDTPPAAPPKSRRGRETVLDMFRTLGVVFALVIPLWFFGQASKSDSKAIRPADPAVVSSLLTSYARDPGGPVPTTLDGWTINIATGEDGVARIGYVRGDSYMEWQGGTGTAFLKDATGEGKQVGTVDVGGVTWQQWSTAGDRTSLVRTAGPATVLVGGIRTTATEAQLEQLAATVR